MAREYVVLFPWDREGPATERRSTESVTVRIVWLGPTGAFGRALGPEDGVTDWGLDGAGWQAHGALAGSAELELAVRRAIDEREADRERYLQDVAWD